MYTVDAGGLAIGDSQPPRIMGVLNVSEESPYDPSVVAEPAEAAAYIDQLIEAGADIVDIGLESANKRFDVLPAAAERERLAVACEALERVSGEAVFSIETRYASVAAESLERGFDMVNDICGFADPEMPTVCAEHEAAVVKMASPPDLERPGAVEETDWQSRRGEAWNERADYVDQIYEALKLHGLTGQTIVDPAFGGWSEAKTLADDRATFRRLREFRALGRPVLVSINRKNFLGDLVGKPTEDRLPASLAATAMAVERGVHVIRTHDVEATRDAAIIAHRLGHRRRRDVGPLSVTTLHQHDPRVFRRHLQEVGIDPPTDLGANVGLEVVGLEERDRRLLAASGLSVVEAPGDGVYVWGRPGDIAVPETDDPEAAPGVQTLLESHFR